MATASKLPPRFVALTLRVCTNSLGTSHRRHEGCRPCPLCTTARSDKLLHFAEREGLWELLCSLLPLAAEEQDSLLARVGLGDNPCMSVYRAAVLVDAYQQRKPLTPRRLSDGARACEAREAAIAHATRRPTRLSALGYGHIM